MKSDNWCKEITDVVSHPEHAAWQQLLPASSVHNGLKVSHTSTDAHACAATPHAWSTTCISIPLLLDQAATAQLLYAKSLLKVSYLGQGCAQCRHNHDIIQAGVPALICS
jgi:hypothetical protein